MSGPIETSVTRLPHCRTKIVATLGPASRDPSVIEELVASGVDVFRLNMSHGDHDTHRALFDGICKARQKLAQAVAVLADLCGPRMRVGKFRSGAIRLTTGDTVTVTTRRVTGEEGLIPSVYSKLSDDVSFGDRILLNDGRIKLEVRQVEQTEIVCEVKHGGVLQDHKGMNLPNVKISAPSLTEKDRLDAAFALELGVDFLALSFVRKADEVKALKALVKEAGARTRVIAKIEKPEALADIEAVLDASDGIMVARGDLGVELPPEAVPVAQDRLVDAARLKDKPVIIATQMLEGMVKEISPTRAEVSDVSHAVASGTDAIMLSAETAVGDHPVAAVRMMDAIARQAEGYLWDTGEFATLTADDPKEDVFPLRDAVARAVSGLSRDLNVQTMLVTSQTGTTARVISANRPSAVVLAVSSDEQVVRQMNLLWGVFPACVPTEAFAGHEALARRLLVKKGLAKDGEYALVVQGFGGNISKSAPGVTVLQI